MAAVEPLILVGSGGFAREAAEVVHAVNAVQPRWDLLGFTDDDPALEGARVKGLPVLGPTAEVVSAHPGARLVLCTVSPQRYFTKRVLERRLALPPERYASLVHPRAALAPSVAVGAGAVVLAGVVATGDATIGPHVGVMPAAVITHDDHLGAFASVASGALLAGGVVLEEEAYVGAGAMLDAGVVVGRGSLVGMGSVVRHDVPPMQVWVGSPARRLRDVVRPGDAQVPSGRADGRPG
ncbi:NeuD/PglB/VioB family sugar acetyltransferase [Kineococcus esterisolvens]|uniref:NeuD/PglB/VioB family sugar acetyltransferase n=1 Tax=unclassified Kineococcus TaxID=2621656 RepID=UPI003D7E729F